MRFKRRIITDSETKSDIKRELECEEAIIAEKKKFTRVRKTFMDYMRAEYGYTADKVLSRINKRISKGYFNRNNQDSVINKLQQEASFPSYDAF